MQQLSSSAIASTAKLTATLPHPRHMQKCTGTSATCPSDVVRRRGYTFKCAGLCYLCGITQAELLMNKV